jgi:hypothetical protein
MEHRVQLSWAVSLTAVLVIIPLSFELIQIQKRKDAVANMKSNIEHDAQVLADFERHFFEEHPELRGDASR